ncbi:hypothetical protein [Leuconostoc gasicomitatum]|uniref:hypothetical protein n=1 Tax=Leuconostoc gasicomitatum TaxID=115778 RepID=UPI001CC4C5D6|nr:hypothetical protein [Leuconostoc gasicomitatum]
MLFLEQTNNQLLINIDNTTQATVDSLSSEQLLKIFENVYIDKNFYEEVDQSTIESIRNPVQREVIDQIIKKLKDFKQNVNEIHHEIEISFPNIQVDDV